MAAETSSGGTVDIWLDEKSRRIDAKIHGPVATSLQRLRLADARCTELSEAIDRTRTRLLNVPHFVEQGIVESLEERILRLQSQLHEERLAAWSTFTDMINGPLADAELERLRIQWLQQIGRIIDPSDDGGIVR